MLPVGGGGDDDNAIFMPLTNVQRRFTGDDNIGYMAVAYDPSYSSAALTRAMVELMREGETKPTVNDMLTRLVASALVLRRTSARAAMKRARRPQSPS